PRGPQMTHGSPQGNHGNAPRRGAPGDQPPPGIPAAGDPAKPRRRGVARRHLILGGAAAGLGALAGAATLLPGRAGEGGAPPSDMAAGQQGEPHGTGTVPFFGPRQAGIDTDAQAHGNFVALELRPDLPRGRVKALLRLLTDDA